MVDRGGVGIGSILYGEGLKWQLSDLRVIVTSKLSLPRGKVG